MMSTISVADHFYREKMPYVVMAILPGGDVVCQAPNGHRITSDMDTLLAIKLNQGKRAGDMCACPYHQPPHRMDKHAWWPQYSIKFPERSER